MALNIGLVTITILLSISTLKGRS